MNGDRFRKSFKTFEFNYRIAKLFVDFSFDSLRIRVFKADRLRLMTRPVIDRDFVPAFRACSFIHKLPTCHDVDRDRRRLVSVVC